MKRRSVLAIVLFVVLLAPQAAFGQETMLTALPGQIAYVGSDFNLYTLNGGEVTMLTDDAGPDDDQIQVYQWPTWATDGRLAYFRLSFTRDGQVTATDAFVSPNGVDAGSELYHGDREVFNYAYWSPQNCDATERCRDLAVLLSRPSARGLAVELVRDTGEAPESATAGVGLPFYYSWSPDGAQMLWHRGEDQLDIYDVNAGDISETLDAHPGTFSAPAWSPVDDRLLFAAQAADGDTTDLVIRANGEQQTLASGVDGFSAFQWSPDGNYVAYTVDQGVLFVLDAVSGETVARAPTTGVLAFFWSPDSTKIAYVSLAAPPGTFSADSGSGARQAALVQEATGLMWSVLSIDTGETRGYTTFLPTRDMLYLLTYFDQFAQSHRIWSPDSRHLIYGEVTEDNQPVLTLLDVTSEESVPLTIAEGFVGVWSFE
jgi:TolB protein